MTITIGKKKLYEKIGWFFSRLEQEPCWHFEQGTGRHAAASRPSMLVILVTPRMCGTSFQDPQAQKKIDDGWPESVEEQGLLLLVWRHHITKQYIKDVLWAVDKRSIKLLHTDACTHRVTHKSFYTQTLLHTNTFTHRRFYTQTLLHTDAFTRRHFYTQTLWHTDTFTHKSVCKQTLAHTE